MVSSVNNEVAIGPLFEAKKSFIFPSLDAEEYHSSSLEKRVESSKEEKTVWDAQIEQMLKEKISRA